MQPLGHFFVSPRKHCLTPGNFSSVYPENHKFDISKWPIKEVVDAIKIMHQLYNSERRGSLSVKIIFQLARLCRFHSNLEEARSIVYYFNLQLQNLGLVVSNITGVRSITTKDKTPPSDEELEILLKKLLEPTFESGSESPVEAACVSTIVAPSKMSISYLVHPYNCMKPCFDYHSIENDTVEQSHDHYPCRK